MATKGNPTITLVGFIVVGFVFISSTWKENYEKVPTDFFPWNEANLVHKKIPNSTTLECRWKGPEFTFDRKEPVFYDA